MTNLFVLITCFLWINQLFAQKNSYLNQESIGFGLSTGFPLYELPEGGYYRPLLIHALYRTPVFRQEKLLNLHISIKPQYAAVYVNQEFHHEAGVNVAFDLSLKISSGSIIAYSTGSGPHFITYQSKRQAKGFIFSDNFFLVFRKRFKAYPSNEFEFFTGIRHISNAGIKRPNGGINNWIAGFSFARLF